MQTEEKQRIVEWVKDPHSCFGTYFVFEPSPNSFEPGRTCFVHFEVHQIVSTAAVKSEPPTDPQFEIYGCGGTGDWTDRLEDACPQVSGFVKFDGCSHVNFGNAENKGDGTDGYLHLCGEKDWKWLGYAMGYVLYRCKKIMEECGTWQP